MSLKKTGSKCFTTLHLIAEDSFECNTFYDQCMIKMSVFWLLNETLSHCLSLRRPSCNILAFMANCAGLLVSTFRLFIIYFLYSDINKASGSVSFTWMIGGIRYPGTYHFSSHATIPTIIRLTLKNVLVVNLSTAGQKVTLSLVSQTICRTIFVERNDTFFIPPERYQVSVILYVRGENRINYEKKSA